jgi:DNA repair protein RadC
MDIQDEIKKFLAEDERNNINYLSRFCKTTQPHLDRIAKGLRGGKNPGIDTVEDIKRGIKKARSHGKVKIMEDEKYVKWLMEKVDNLEQEVRRLLDKNDELTNMLVERRTTLATEGGGKKVANGNQEK